MRVSSVPTSAPPPLSISSGRSVLARSTPTGTDSAAPSSCKPPESVNTSVDSRKRDSSVA